MPGNRNSRGFGSGSRTPRETGADTEPSGAPGATGNRSPGQAEPGRRGQRATEVHEQPETRRRQQRATGVAGESTNLRWYRATGVTGEAETNFRKCRATGTSTEHRATGVPRNLRATGDFNRRREGSRRGTVTERARGAGAQALRPHATAASGSWARVAEARSSKSSDRRGRDPARDPAPFAFVAILPLNPLSAPGTENF